MKHSILIAVLVVLFQAVASADPTFTKDVAPVLYKHCLECHREGLSGPFPLETFADVRKRGKQIVEVTQSSYMPPWLPAHKAGTFDGERGLSDTEKELLKKWFDAGMPEGAKDVAPPLPAVSGDWSLGKPDLIVRPEGEYELPADASTDVFRNFVIRLPVARPRYVRAVDFKARDPRIVHHAIMKIDRSGESRKLQEADPLPGYGHDMNLPHASNPDGHFLGWTPGKRPYESPDSAWRLMPGDELVVQLHLQPSGKKEAVRPEIAFYFTDQAPERLPVGILLYSLDLDIPAQARDYKAADSYTLPVDCHVRIVYPHAHFLGRSVTIAAKPPESDEQVLLDIPSWDFNWQDSYIFKKPRRLPAGTKIAMSWVFDNSDKNVRNPNFPPVAVRYGLRTVDEMASAWLQLMPVNDADHARLKSHYDQHLVGRQIMRGREALKKRPNDIKVHGKLASLYMRSRNHALARTHYEKMIEIDPLSYVAFRGRGDVARFSRRYDAALKDYRQALAIQPGDAELICNIGTMHHQLGDLRAAEKNYLRSIELLPDQVEARFNLGVLYESQGQKGKAWEQFRAAFKVDPSNTAVAERLQTLRPK